METLSVNSALFNKYSIEIAENDIDYIVKKYDDKGNKTEVTDAAEKASILSGATLGGSIGFTKDKKHTGWLHILICRIQQIAEFLTGHRDLIKKPSKTYANSCHSFIIMGEAKDAEGKAFPANGMYAHLSHHEMMTADPLFPGILLRSFDNLREKDVTKIYLYSPRDELLRNTIYQYALKTSIPKKTSSDNNKPIQEWRYYRPGCVENEDDKVDFSVSRLAIGIFYNSSAKLVHKVPIDRILQTTSLLIADLMLSGPNDIKDEEGNKRTFYCCSYVTTLLQGALYMRNIDVVDPKEFAAFKQDEFQNPLDRITLAKKIMKSFTTKTAQKNSVEYAISKTFKSLKFARADSEFLASSRFVELADKSSFKYKA